jgi:hypothetical protein
MYEPFAPSNVTAMIVSGGQPFGLRPDGRLVQGIYHPQGPLIGSAEMEDTAADIVAIESKGQNVIGIRENGTVILWNHVFYAQTNGGLLSWASRFDVQTNVPPGLSNVIAVAAGSAHSMALKSDGTVAAWGNNAYSQTNVPTGLTNVAAIGCGTFQSFAITGVGRPFLTAPITDRVGALGGKVYFRMQASGQHPLSYQWRCNGTNLPGATNMLLTLTNLQASQAGFYSVVVSNAFGTNISREASLTTAPFFITQHPRSAWVLTNASTNFQISVKSSFPLSYQWRFNTGDIVGETNATLALSNITAAAGGSYLVVVSNSFGAVTSAVATLTVVAPENAFSVPYLYDGWFITRFSGIPGITYAIEWTPSLYPPDWQWLNEWVAPTSDEGFGIGVFEFRFPFSDSGDFFFRAKRLP